MGKKLILSFIISLLFVGMNAQNQESVLMKINNRPITKAEFEYLYNKNNTASKQPLTEYLDLFVNYKLKVEEAITLGYDTTQVFLTEYNNYKRQITEPYLTDTINEQVVAKKIYDRMGENVEVSHILVRFPQTALLPKDTLDAYKKTLLIREKLIGKKAQSFEDVAKEYSEDPSAKQSERAGYLGWSTAMSFVPSFEDGMYATKVNEISMPVRSSFGYHLIKIHNRKADPGKAKLAHIMLAFMQQNPSQHYKDSVKKVADEVYAKLLSGGSYAQLAKEYSSDKRSAMENGGSIGWVRAGLGLPTEFMDAGFALKDTGNITKPIETGFGYHIIKLEDKAPRDSWAEAKPTIISQIKNTPLNEEVQKLEKEKLALTISSKLNDETYNYLMSLANSYYPLDSLYLADMAANNKVLLSVADKNYDLNNFSDYLKTKANVKSNLSTDFLGKVIDNFTLLNMKEEYVNSLGNKYPEYANLLKEYHDGILLFNVMNDEVWENATNNTEGLTDYFNKNKAKYSWSAPRYKGYIVYCKDEKTLKAAQKLVKKVKAGEDLNAYIKTALNNDSVNFVFAKRGVWSKGDNKFIDFSVFKGSEKPEPIKDYPFYFVTGKIQKNPEEYLDAKGLVISDLQEQREKDWVSGLKAKYQVEVNQAVLGTIK